MFASVARKQNQLHAIEIAEEQGGGRSSPGTVDPTPLGVLEVRDPINPAASDHAEPGGRMRCRHGFESFVRFRPESNDLDEFEPCRPGSAGGGMREPGRLPHATDAEERIFVARPA